MDSKFYKIGELEVLRLWILLIRPIYDTETQSGKKKTYVILMTNANKDQLYKHRKDINIPY